MALQPSYEKLKNDCFKKLTSVQTVVTARLTSEGVKIAKMLSVSADAHVLSCESLSGEAKMSGRVEFKALFVDAAGDNHCLTSYADFSDKLVSPEITPALTPFAESMVFDVDTQAVSGEEIKLSAVIETALFGVLAEEHEYLKSGGEELFVQTETLKTQSLSGRFSGEIEISEEFPCGRAARRVMLVNVHALCEEAKSGIESVVVKGKAAVCVTLENEGGALEAVWRVIPFEQEIPANGVFSGDMADAEIKVSKCSLELNLEEDGSVAACQITLDVKGAAFRPEEFEVITDAFSVVNETKLTTSSIEITKTLFTRSFETKIEGTAALEAEMPQVDKIIAALSPRINIANVYPDADRLVIEGVLSASVIYYNTELNNLNSVQVELPYSISLNAAGVTDQSKLAARGMPLSVGARVRKINEVEVYAEALLTVTVSSSEIGCAVTGIESGAERIATNAAMSVYVTGKDESLWDAAKSLITTPELILAQNPELKLPLEGGERILVYNQLKAKMR